LNSDDCIDDCGLNNTNVSLIWSTGPEKEGLAQARRNKKTLSVEGGFDMAKASLASRKQQLRNAGCPELKGKKSEELLSRITDDEFHTLLTVRSKINSKKDRDDYDSKIVVMGF
jgi:hypothetical protein